MKRQENADEPCYRQARYSVPLIMEYYSSNDIGNADDSSGSMDDHASELRKYLPDRVIRKGPLRIPRLPEHVIARHYTRLAEMNYGITNGIYPLGSCTMKYNPAILMEFFWDENANNIHPYQPVEHVQGALQVLYEVGQILAELGGMDAITFQPAAGAHGEYTGLSVVRAYFDDKGEDRSEIVLPDTAHGTNPASAAMAGYDVVEIRSKHGHVDLSALRAAVSKKTAAFMLTNPNTLGLFEKNVLKIAKVVHESGAILYYDGANLNAIMGIAKPGAMGFDIVHFNLHKTFATPHGGGGPGAGPIGVKEFLAPYLPVPRVVKTSKGYALDASSEKTIGRVHACHGNFAVALMAYLYLIMMGLDGLRSAAERAVLNANYLMRKIEKLLSVPYKECVMHEFVASCAELKSKGITARDVAKRLLDFGYHPPTIYFPTLIEEAFMIEPTECERKSTLDAYAATIEKIINERADVLRSAPHNTAVRRVDEVHAAKSLIFTYRAWRKKHEKR